MVKHKRLIKLHIELDVNEASRLRVLLLKNAVQLSLLKYINLYKRNHKLPYPVSFRDLVRLVKVYWTKTDVYVGIVYDFLRPKDKPLYLKILEVEFGVNGIEQRVLRRALEECFIDL